MFYASFTLISVCACRDEVGFFNLKQKHSLPSIDTGLYAGAAGRHRAFRVSRTRAHAYGNVPVSSIRGRFANHSDYAAFYTWGYRPRPRFPAVGFANSKKLNNWTLIHLGHRVDRSPGLWPLSPKVVSQSSSSTVPRSLGYKPTVLFCPDCLPRLPISCSW